MRELCFFASAACLLAASLVLYLVLGGTVGAADGWQMKVSDEATDLFGIVSAAFFFAGVILFATGALIGARRPRD